MSNYRYYIHSYVLFLFFFHNSILLAQENLQAVIENVLPSVVTILAYDEDDNVGQGSGFFFSKDGLILTSRHVLDKAKHAQIKLGTGEVFDIVEIIAENEELDILIIKTNIDISSIPYLTINEAIPSVGERVIVVGSPLGFEKSVSDGIIASVREMERFGEIYQITAPASPGSSGGPVLNTSGEVIGVVTFQFRSGQNLNFAIPAYHALKMSTDYSLKFSSWYGINLISNIRDANSWYHEGIKHMALNDYASAISNFEKAIEINPNADYVIFRMGYCFYHLHYYEKAMYYYSAAIKINPNDDFYYWSRASIKSDFYADYIGAIQDLNKAINLNPREYSYYYSSRGDAKNHLGDYLGAIQDYERAIYVNPLDDFSYYSRGEAKEKIGDHAAAMLDYNKAITINPKQEVYYLGRGLLKIDLGNYFEAILDFTYAISLNPCDMKFRFRGFAKLIMGDNQGAINDYSRAVEINPWDGVNYYYRGISRIANGDIYLGCLDLSKAGELGYADAYDEIRRKCR